MIKNYRILIIDDDPGIRDTYRQILADRKPDELLQKGSLLFEGEKETLNQGRNSYQLILVSRGEEGVGIVEESIRKNQQISLVFMDMAISGMNGAETAGRIWAIDNAVKIVFVTAFNEYTPDDIIQEIGRDDIFYLRKPFNADEIRQFARALTDEWRLEREKEALSLNLQKSNDELEKLNRTLNEQVRKQTATMVQSEKMISLGILTTGIAQKIIKPVYQIRENLELMIRNSECKSQFADVVSESISHIERIQEIVSDLSTISSADDTDFTEKDIRQILDTALNVTYNKQKHQIQVVKEYSETPPIRCLPQRLSQAFVNILINAVQAITSSGIITVTTELVQEGKRVADKRIKITIADSGQGIAEENLSKIFDPFYSTKSPGEGTGLGMNVTYDIIRQHHGDIEIKSKKNVGTAVTVILPLSGATR